MEYNGKYYYKIEWSCGFSGTDDYDIIESEVPMSPGEVSDQARERWFESCGEYSGAEPNEDEMIEAGYMPDPDDE